MTQPSAALWHAGGPLLALIAVGWLLVGLAVGAGLGVAVAAAVARLRPRRVGAGEPSPPQTADGSLAAELVHAREAETIAEVLLRHVEQRVGVEIAALARVDGEGRRAEGFCARSAGRDVDFFRGFEFDLTSEASAIAAAVSDAAPVTAFEAAGSAGVDPLVDELDAKSLAYVPLVADERVVAVLVVGTTRQHRAFTSAELELLQALTADAAPALASALATAEFADELERERRRAEQQRALLRAGQGLTSDANVSSVDAALAAVADTANDVLGGSFAAVLTPQGRAFAATDAREFPSELADALADGLPAGARCLTEAAANDRVVASSDVTNDERFDSSWRELTARSGYHALLALPIPSVRSAKGVALVFYVAARSFTDDELELARHLASAASGTVQRSELVEAERTARNLSQQLAYTGRVLATELDPAAVLEEVVQHAPALLGADASAIRSVEADDLVISAASGDALEETVGLRSSTIAGPSGDVFQSRSPVPIVDASTDDLLVAMDPILAAGYASFLGVPLTGPDGTMHGVLAVYAREPRVWQPEEIEALLSLGATTSAALSNAELYSRVSLENERSIAILANIADGIVALDRDGKVVLWNAAAEQITGVPADEALGRTPAQVLQRTLEAEDDASAAGPRLVSIMRGGEEVWLSLSEAVMRDPLGAVAGRIFAFRDISADRTVEQVKSDFVAAVSHQLRTPLTSIYGFAETLLREDVLFGEEDRRTFLGYIASESERLTGIVDELLNVARLDAGDLHVEPEPIDVASVVSEVVETALESGAVNGHRFELDLPPEPLAAEADRDKLRQVFNILVENALKYSPNGGTVTVGARRGDGTVEVRVIDEGVGIPPAEQERIFRKFYRAEATVRDGAGGTGLGLFIAKELVTAMGGRIWVESAEGEGAKFAFELPAAQS